MFSCGFKFKTMNHIKQNKSQDHVRSNMQTFLQFLKEETEDHSPAFHDWTSGRAFWQQSKHATGSGFYKVHPLDSEGRVDRHGKASTAPWNHSVKKKFPNVHVFHTAAHDWKEKNLKEEKTGAHGWPLVPSTKFPGEHTLACPNCGKSNITMSVVYGPRGRLGDPGAHDTIKCNDCGHHDMKPSKPMTWNYFKEGVEEHEKFKDPTQNPFHKILTQHGFQHVSTKHEQNRFNRDPKHDYTEHRYEHPNHGKSHVIVTQEHGANPAYKNDKPNHFLHRHEQENKIMAPASGESKGQLHRSLSSYYGVPAGMEAPRLTAWEKKSPRFAPQYKMNEVAIPRSKQGKRRAVGREQTFRAVKKSMLQKYKSSFGGKRSLSRKTHEFGSARGYSVSGAFNVAEDEYRALEATKHEEVASKFGYTPKSDYHIRASATNLEHKPSGHVLSIHKDGQWELHGAGANKSGSGAESLHQHLKKVHFLQQHESFQRNPDHQQIKRVLAENGYVRGKGGVYTHADGSQVKYPLLDGISYQIVDEGFIDHSAAILEEEITPEPAIEIEAPIFNVTLLKNVLKEATLFEEPKTNSSTEALPTSKKNWPYHKVLSQHGFHHNGSNHPQYNEYGHEKHWYVGANNNTVDITHGRDATSVGVKHGSKKSVFVHSPEELHQHLIGKFPPVHHEDFDPDPELNYRIATQPKNLTPSVNIRTPRYDRNWDYDRARMEADREKKLKEGEAEEFQNANDQLVGMAEEDPSPDDLMRASLCKKTNGKDVLDELGEKEEKKPWRVIDMTTNRHVDTVHARTEKGAKAAMSKKGHDSRFHIVREETINETKRYTHKFWTGPVMAHDKGFIKKLHRHYPNTKAGTEHMYVHTDHPAEHVVDTLKNKMGIHGFKAHAFQTKVHSDAGPRKKAVNSTGKPEQDVNWLDKLQ